MLFSMKETELLYRKMGEHFKTLDKWQMYIITSHEEFCKLFGRKADNTRKMYNGMLRCFYYQYYKKNK